MDPTSTDFDRTNNVEQVLWENIQPGSVSVIVRAFHITSLLQSYALVIRIQEKKEGEKASHPRINT